MSKRGPAGEKLILEGLNPQQAAAVRHGDGPLLVIAGAGSGKTKTLVHRFAHLIARGADPRRILLLTFTRRAAAEMLRRVDGLLRSLNTKRGQPVARASWGGTFHATASRLLRVYGKAIGLPSEFTIHDRGDSEDLLDVVRTELGLAKTDKRFPKKRTCLAIYSHSVNSLRPLDELLDENYPWCAEWVEELKGLFGGYVDRKQEDGVLDYDDLLLYWHALLEEKIGDKVRARFNHVFVDEYQDTNKLQAGIVRMLRPDASGVTVVGDDAQSIYSFRAATVRNILDFPTEFPGTEIIKLEQNYRSTQPILSATNEVIGAAKERFTKNLWTEREAGGAPQLVSCQDEDEQAAFIIKQILEHREAGIDLQRQAVLFRAGHHSIALETELAARNIPFVKYGGLKFLEAAHVKDLMSFLRLAENPRDLVAGSRVLQLLPGIGPRKALGLMRSLAAASATFTAWSKASVPKAAKELWPGLTKLLRGLASADLSVPVQIGRIRKYYQPLLEDKYDNAPARLRDLEQLEVVAARFDDRRTMLTDMALDPPSSTEDLAGVPHLDEDFLILSTIHSAKGLEWDAVFVIHASDGNIPSDMATGSDEQIEEELRLFYVALTRARDWLYVCFPQRYYYANRGRTDQHTFSQLTRFVTPAARAHFEECAAGIAPRYDELDPDDDGDWGAVDGGDRVRRRIRSLWS